jgi:hypothetical protein
MIIKKNILFLFLFYFLGAGTGLIGEKLLFTKKDDNDNFKAGWLAAEKRLDDIGSLYGVKNDYEIKTISGTVDKIDGDQIQIKIMPLEPLADPDLDYRTVNVNTKTIISKIIKKSDEQYQQEIKELSSQDIQKRGPDSPDGSVNLYDTNNVDIGQISVGSQITVYSSENIKEKKIILANKIIISK